MPDIPTIQVYWPAQGKGIFQINESDFDPRIHKKLSDKEEAAAESAGDSDSRTKAALTEAAESKGLDVTSSMTKADITDLLDLANKTKAELTEMAEAKGLDVKGFSKAEIADALNRG